MRLFFWVFLVLSGLGGVTFYWLTSPERIYTSMLVAHEKDLANGERVFWAAGCGSCHAAEKAKGDAKMRLGGGLALKTPFGTFNVPNISPDRLTGIGTWTDAEFATAMIKGVSPDDRHYFPAFPYTSYQRMSIGDVLDLRGFLDTLPAVVNTVPPHEVSFPYSFRRGIGLWKLLYLDGKRFEPDPMASAELNRGAYLVQGPGHCGECHTPRNAIGGFIAGRALAGAKAPEGDGFVPNITPHETGIGGWSEADIAYALESGFTPEFDTLGGSMTSVQENIAHLPAEDRAAIATYLKSIPPLPSDRP